MIQHQRYTLTLWEGLKTASESFDGKQLIAKYQAVNGLKYN